MEFLWITLSVTIFVLQRGSHAEDTELLKANSEGFCPSGWLSFGEFCFKGFSGRADFENAQKECVSQGAHLATITSQEMQDFLTARILLSMKYKAFIGLRHNTSADKFHWTDGSEAEFTAWDQWEPTRNKDETCVEMKYNELLGILGKWNDIPCYWVLPYICQKLKDPATERPEKEPNPCSQTTDGIAFMTSCYYFSAHLKTWDEAEKYCMEHYKGHLATVTDAVVQKFLHYEVKTDNAALSTLWIGIKLKPDEVDMWSSGWYLAFHNWKHKDANKKVPSTSCAAMTKDTGEWTLDSCDKQLSFICENSSVVPPAKLKPTTPGLKCPSKDWTDLGGDFCYIFGRTAHVNWYEANFFCMRKGGTLVSIHSEQEQQALAQFFTYVETPVLIGLFKHDNDQMKGELQWVDNSPVDYTNWRYGEPNTKTELCSEIMPFISMLWNDMDCSSKGKYICSIPKKASGNHTNVTPSDPKLKECDCLPTPAIVGVVLCVLLVIILLGVVLYNVIPCSKKSEQQNSRERKTSATNGKHLYTRRELVVSEPIYETMDDEV